ncbi:MAG TPA: cache domain-containing protein [Motiliproteus sp.]
MTAIQRFSGVVAAVLLLCSFNAAADGRGTSRQARLLLDNAIQLLESKGPKAAFAAFNDQQGPFIQQDLYIFAIDLKGTYQASGANPKLVGSSLAGVSDAAGTPVGQEILTLAERMGYGLVEYEWLNRQTNDVEHKFTRIQRVGDYILGVGFYLPEES